MTCYCCSEREFEDCCAPFIKGFAKPATALELMRSRYTAYATARIEYILQTTHPSMRRLHKPEEIEQWARSSRWQRLEILSTADGKAKDKRGKVEFKAYFLD